MLKVELTGHCGIILQTFPAG